MTGEQVGSEVVFDFDQLIASLRMAVTTFPDKRTGKNKKYQMQDAVSGALSVFFTQCPSFLSHQKLMQSRYGLSNAKTLFAMKHIPTPYTGSSGYCCSLIPGLRV